MNNSGTADPKLPAHSPTTTLAAALAYAQRGWRVIPLHDLASGHCSCGRPDAQKGHTPGKHPRIDDWGTEASTDAAAIQHWWQQWPTAHVGIVTGLGSRLAILDVDPRNGGEESLKDLERGYAPLPDTPLVLSGGGGMHYYFLLETPCPSADPAPGLNFLAEGAIRRWRPRVCTSPGGTTAGRWPMSQRSCPWPRSLPGSSPWCRKRPRAAAQQQQPCRIPCRISRCIPSRSAPGSNISFAPGRIRSNPAVTRAGVKWSLP